jgi:putative transposase
MQVLWRVLPVRAADYYRWRSWPAPEWEPAATATFSRPAQRYGTRRLRAVLRAEGHTAGRYALRNWRHRRGLRALRMRPHRPRTTVAAPEAGMGENRLFTQPTPTAPN